MEQTVVCSTGLKSETDEKPNKKVEISSKGEGFDDEILKLKALHEKYQKRSHQLKHSESKHSDAREIREASPVLVSSEVAQTAGNFAEVETSTVEGKVAIEETVPLSDESLFVRFEYTNRRYEGTDVGPETGTTAEDMELDVEDIDKQLEMALERRQVGYTHSVSVYSRLIIISCKQANVDTWLG